MGELCVREGRRKCCCPRLKCCIMILKNSTWVSEWITWGRDDGSCWPCLAVTSQRGDGDGSSRGMSPVTNIAATASEKKLISHETLLQNLLTRQCSLLVLWYRWLSRYRHQAIRPLSGETLFTLCHRKKWVAKKGTNFLKAPACSPIPPWSYGVLIFAPFDS